MPVKGKVKQPMYIVGRDDKPFGFAGLWERWEPPGGEPIESCTLITTTANEVIAPFHERMPVILAPDDYDLWLAPDVHESQRLLPLLKPYPAEKMEAYPVSLAVNSPSRESPECVKPLSEQSTIVRP
jgi:putative SOS response-associated peptidase YedK